MNAVALAAALVAIDSRNPVLVPGAPGEGGVARFLAGLLEEWGFRVDVTDVVAGRPNVVARAGRGRGGRTLMLNGHTDVVGTDGMTHHPFHAGIRDGRLYGRGSADMKGGLASMCVAAREAVAMGIDGEVIVAAVVDEEYASIGTRALLDAGVRADAAVVVEPTRLALAPAHRGFAWASVEVRGRAAHGSRYDIGVDAITRAAMIVAELDVWQRDHLTRRVHPLLGRGSLHASSVSGGTGLTTYPERCVVELERRTLPGEDAEEFLREIEGAVERVRRVYPDLDVEIRPIGGQPPSDVSPDAPIAAAVSSAIGRVGHAVRVEGMSAWTDAALLNAAGIPAVCFGPGDIALAHAAEEFIPTSEIDAAAEVMARLVYDWCNTPCS